MGLRFRCASLKTQGILFFMWARFRVTMDRFVDRGAGDQQEVWLGGSRVWYTVWVQTWVLLCFVILGELFGFSGPQFPHV